MKVWCNRAGVGESACFGSVLEDVRIRYDDENTEKLFGGVGDKFVTVVVRYSKCQLQRATTNQSH